MGQSPRKSHQVFLINLDEQAHWGGCENRLVNYFRSLVVVKYHTQIICEQGQAKLEGTVAVMVILEVLDSYLRNSFFSI